MKTNIQYISDRLIEIGFNSTEISSFLTTCYTIIQQSKDLESQIYQSGNKNYINAFSLLSDDLISLTNEEWRQWKLS